MNTVAENIIEEPVENTTDDKKSGSSNDEALDEQETSKASSEFAIKLVNSVKSLNNEEITHYELVNLFNSAEELRCLFLFIRALPYNPIAKIYPEVPFLFFKGVMVPHSLLIYPKKWLTISRHL